MSVAIAVHGTHDRRPPRAPGLDHRAHRGILHQRDIDERDEHGFELRVVDRIQPGHERRELSPLPVWILNEAHARVI
jgi:hypothetical protein